MKGARKDLAAPPALLTLEQHPSAVLALLDAPISFHRAYIAITGRVTAALLLSCAVELTYRLAQHRESERAATIDRMDADGWFARSLEQWQQETGLSRDELATARRTLRELALIEERQARLDGGMRVQLQTRVRADRLQLLVDDYLTAFATAWESGASASPLAFSGNVGGGGLDRLIEQPWPAGLVAVPRPSAP